MSNITVLEAPIEPIKVINNREDLSFKWVKPLHALENDELQIELNLTCDDVFTLVMTPHNEELWEGNLRQAKEYLVFFDLIKDFLQGIMRKTHYCLNVATYSKSKYGVNHAGEIKLVKNIKNEPSGPPSVEVVYPNEITFCCSSNPNMRKVKSRSLKKKSTGGNIEKDEVKDKDKYEDEVKDRDEDEVKDSDEDRDEDRGEDEDKEFLSPDKDDAEDIPMIDPKKCAFKIVMHRVNNFGFYQVQSYSPLSSHTKACFSSRARRSKETVLHLINSVLRSDMRLAGYLDLMGATHGTVDVCGESTIYSAISQLRRQHQKQYEFAFEELKTMNREDIEQRLRQLDCSDKVTREVIGSLAAAENSKLASFHISTLGNRILCLPFFVSIATPFTAQVRRCIIY